MPSPRGGGGTAQSARRKPRLNPWRSRIAGRRSRARDARNRRNDRSPGVQPGTEADPVAILFQFLVGMGNVLGRKRYFTVGPTRHYLVFFAAMVGLTSAGRKGTSRDIVRWLLA